MINLDFSQCKTEEDKKKVFSEAEQDLATLRKIWLGESKLNNLKGGKKHNGKKI